MERMWPGGPILPGGLSRWIVWATHDHRVFSDWRNPASLEDGEHTVTITPADLDPQGCFFFDDESGEPLIFIATHVKLGLESGLLNLDLIGTFFDFDVSSTGQWANGKADNWYSSEIQNFWVKGESASCLI